MTENFPIPLSMLYHIPGEGEAWERERDDERVSANYNVFWQLNGGQQTSAAVFDTIQMSLEEMIRRFCLNKTYRVTSSFDRDLKAEQSPLTTKHAWRSRWDENWFCDFYNKQLRETSAQLTATRHLLDSCGVSAQNLSRDTNLQALFMVKVSVQTSGFQWCWIWRYP